MSWREGTIAAPFCGVECCGDAAREAEEAEEDEESVSCRLRWRLINSTTVPAEYVLYGRLLPIMVAVYVVFPACTLSLHEVRSLWP